MIVATETARCRPIGYGICISQIRKNGEFRVIDRCSSLERAANAFTKIAPELDYWTLRTSFDALKSLPEKGRFMEKFKATKLHFELAAKAENGMLVEAAVFIVDECNARLAAARWIRNQGPMFFQNFLDEPSHSVQAVLASVEARASAAPLSR